MNVFNKLILQVKAHSLIATSDYRKHTSQRRFKSTMFSAGDIVRNITPKTSTYGDKVMFVTCLRGGKDDQSGNYMVLTNEGHVRVVCNITKA